MKSKSTSKVIDLPFIKEKEELLMKKLDSDIKKLLMEKLDNEIKKLKELAGKPKNK